MDATPDHHKDRAHIPEQIKAFHLLREQECLDLDTDDEEIPNLPKVEDVELPPIATVSDGNNGDGVGTGPMLSLYPPEGPAFTQVGGQVKQ